MPRFPTFNGPVTDDSAYKPMEVDEGHLSSLCAHMDVLSPEPPVYSDVPMVEQSFPDFPVQSGKESKHSESSSTTTLDPRRSFLSRMINHLGDVEEETLRRIAMLPYMMSGYIQLLFNISLPALLLYWLFSFGQTIQSDVEKKVLLFSEDVMEQIAKCSRDYRDNRCDPSTRVPALISACQSWEECMTRDPHLVAKRSGIAAEIFGETLNSFFNVLSWKSIVSLIVLVIGVAALFNITFSMVSRRNPAATAGLEDHHSATPKPYGRKSLTAGSHASPLVNRRRKFH
jgi:disulfide bond formation protein DsbB